ncbi:MAG TPA: hypothetical protein VFF30_12645 [Nitrososphaerales archaeon]|nr:hypothetical protein [Nitrososphaerales archaeon]
MQRIQRRLGERSKVAGASFAVISIFFLILSYFSNFIVFEIDSLVAFIAAIILLTREPSNSIQSRLVNRILDSLSTLNDQLAQGLSFRDVVYVATGPKVSDVVLGTSDPVREALEPPGKSLAQLFCRQMNADHVTLSDLDVQLPRILTQDFRLASDVVVNRDGDSKVDVRILNPALNCSNRAVAPGNNTGMIGCALGSLVAILYANATTKVVRLVDCSTSKGRNMLDVRLSLTEKAGGVH